MTGDLELRIAMQADAIVGDAMREAFRWQMHKERSREDYFAPLLFAMPGVELPIVPRVASPMIDVEKQIDAITVQSGERAKKCQARYDRWLQYATKRSWRR